MTFKLLKVDPRFSVPGATKKTFPGDTAKGGRVNVGVARNSEWLLKDLFNLLTWLVQFNLVVENFLFSHLRHVRFKDCLCLGELTEMPFIAVCLEGEFWLSRSFSCKVLLTLNDFQSTLFAEGRNPLGERFRPKNIYGFLRIVNLRVATRV